MKINLASIGGKVIGRNGMPIVDARVMIVDGPSHTDIAALTNDDGRFRFDNLCPGNYKLLICHDNYESVTTTCSVQNQDNINQEIKIS